MNEENKQKINKKYARQLEKGERFWPDSIFKDVIMAFGLFIVVILLATFVGITPEPKADPSDSSYIPRPEWYFLFLFKFLALYGQIPLIGKIEWPATVLIPGLVVTALTLLPFIEKSPYRYYGKRVLPLSVMAIFVVSMVTLTMLSDVPTTSEGVYVAGILQIIGGLVAPGLGLAALFVMAFTLKEKAAKPMIWTAGATSALIVVLTVVTLVIAPPSKTHKAEVATTLPEQIMAGQDLYSLHCVECHGDDGKVTVIEGVQGLEGKVIGALNDTDTLHTFTDETLANITIYGQPNQGMPPYGIAGGGELTRSQVDYIVTFMRYSWDDRFEMPPMKPLFPPLAAGEVPSYDVHIEPISKRYCLSCHRPGKDNNNYWMTTYDETINTGDNAPNLEAGNPESILLLTIQGTSILDDNGDELIGMMPPTKLMRPDAIDAWVRWVMAGMPKTAEEAATLSSPPTPAP